MTVNIKVSNLQNVRIIIITRSFGLEPFSVTMNV